MVHYLFTFVTRLSHDSWESRKTSGSLYRTNINLADRRFYTETVRKSREESGRIKSIQLNVPGDQLHLWAPAAKTVNKNNF